MSGIVVVSRDPRTAGFRWIIDGRRVAAGDAGKLPQEAACTAVTEAIRYNAKIMAPPEVAVLIPQKYLL